MSARKKPEQRPCPVCGDPAATRYRPFCSKRCADVDLNRWLTGAYAIPAEEEDTPGAEDFAALPANGTGRGDN